MKNKNVFGPDGTRWSLRIPAPLSQRIIKLAESERRTKHNMVLVLLDEAVRTRDNEVKGAKIQ